MLLVQCDEFHAAYEDKFANDVLHAKTLYPEVLVEFADGNFRDPPATDELVARWSIKRTAYGTSWGQVESSHHLINQ